MERRAKFIVTLVSVFVILAILIIFGVTTGIVSYAVTSVSRINDVCEVDYRDCVHYCGEGASSGECKDECADTRRTCVEEARIAEEKALEEARQELEEETTDEVIEETEDLVEEIEEVAEEIAEESAEENGDCYFDVDITCLDYSVDGNVKSAAIKIKNELGTDMLNIRAYVNEKDEDRFLCKLYCVDGCIGGSDGQYVTDGSQATFVGDSYCRIPDTGSHLSADLKIVYEKANGVVIEAHGTLEADVE